MQGFGQSPECPEFLGSKLIRSGIKIPCASPDPSEPPGKKRVLGSTPDPSGIGSEARQSPAQKRRLAPRELILAIFMPSNTFKI